MNEVEMQAKATIAAALIASGKYDMASAFHFEANPLGYFPLANLRVAVDTIYRGLFNPK